MVVAMAISVDSEILSESCKGFQWRYDAMAMLLCTSECGYEEWSLAALFITWEGKG